MITGINIIGIFVIVVCAVLTVLIQKPEQYANTMPQSSPTYTLNTKIPTLSDNVCSVKCCPGEFGCSGGCICMSKQQSETISYRGNNAKGAA
jgi:hypothetical protein